MSASPSDRNTVTFTASALEKSGANVRPKAITATLEAINIGQRPTRSAADGRQRNRQREEQHADHLQRQELLRA